MQKQAQSSLPETAGNTESSSRGKPRFLTNYGKSWQVTIYLCTRSNVIFKSFEPTETGLGCADPSISPALTGVAEPVCAILAVTMTLPSNGVSGIMTS